MTAAHRRHAEAVSALVLRARQSVDAPWFAGAWNLNLAIIRGEDVGTWGDLIAVATEDDIGRPVALALKACGSAWVGEWGAPTAPGGCVYVVQQYAPGGYALGTHRGRPALVQRKPFRLVRWPPGREIPSASKLEHLATTDGFDGIVGANLHNLSGDRSPGALPGRDDSEGCTLAAYQHEYGALLALVRRQAERRGSSVVSPAFVYRSDIG